MQVMVNKVPDKKSNWSLKEFLVFAFLTLIIVVPIRLFIAQPFIVNGSSMSPTFETGQYLIVDQVNYAFAEPQRGDVVVFHFPQDESKYFIKRIIALPGETIEIKGEEVYITNDFTTNSEQDTDENLDAEPILLEEPYVEFEKDNYLTVTLADDEYFVMGDNRLASLDSRIWGPLKKDYIVGRAYLRLLPINAVDYLPGSY